VTDLAATARAVVAFVVILLQLHRFHARTALSFAPFSIELQLPPRFSLAQRGLLLLGLQFELRGLLPLPFELQQAFTLGRLALTLQFTRTLDFGDPLRAFNVLALPSRDQLFV
jgi:hypothetical protein